MIQRTFQINYPLRAWEIETHPSVPLTPGEIGREAVDFSPAPLILETVSKLGFNWSEPLLWAKYFNLPSVRHKWIMISEYHHRISIYRRMNSIYSLPNQILHCLSPIYRRFSVSTVATAQNFNLPSLQPQTTVAAADFQSTFNLQSQNLNLLFPTRVLFYRRWEQ